MDVRQAVLGDIAIRSGREVSSIDVGVLIRRRSRNWFHFAEKLRAEHSKHLARFSLRLPRSRAKVKRLPGLEE